MFDLDTTLNTQYPTLAKFSSPVKAAEREIVGRQHEISQLMAAMSRPELCNALLLAPAGAGKSALVQGAMLQDTERSYFEVDVAGMVSGLKNLEEMAGLLKQFFDEAEAFADDGNHGLVLFMDEFHQIVQLSPAAVEALKPILAASGARGIRIIAATTYDEFKTHIAPNQPLVERLQRINLTPTDRKTTISILKGMTVRYKVADQFFDDHLLEQIYDLTERYVPASSQPRKSILVLDSMVGWHRSPSKRSIDRTLLADVLLESINVNIAFRVDALKMKAQLDSKVYSQHAATEAVARRLQLCVADLHDKGKPMSSFLFAGSTGVGKSELTKQLARLLFGDDQRRLIRFDMTEYAADTSLAAFKSELSSRVWQMGHAVILFDEVEKASPLVTRLLLQVLDDGRLTDDNNREVSFLNTYIVLTTNAGSEIFATIAQYEADDDGSGKKLKEYTKQIRRSITNQQNNRFPPELLGRIDSIVAFQPLSLETQRKIVKNKMIKMAQEVLSKHGVRMTMDPKVLQYLIDDKGDTESNAGGARAAIGKFTEDVTTEVAAFINRYPREKAIRIEIIGELASDHKDQLKSEAYVEVTASR